ncbi:MAG: sugar phosphate isomerase/epimerase [Actinobacteria bacterium]|nr:sugar phosphate isomerase/epimerase [Actinomycetota bacterium]
MTSRQYTIGLSSSSVYPESTAVAFELAADLGYDGVEVMVGTDAMSQDLATLKGLVDHYQVPVLSIHAPCLLVHPPFRWQREYARSFEDGIARMEEVTDVVFAVENMYPWRAGPSSLGAYAPNWDIRHQDYRHATVDLSHTAVSRTDPRDMVRDLADRVAHLHLADGTDSARDEHLVPGRGNQPVAEVLARLAEASFGGSVIAEVSTRSAQSRDERVADLRETLNFARRHLGGAS